MTRALSPIAELHPPCLGYTKDGHPLHPLMVSYKTPLVLFSRKASPNTP